jgi:hypothetical protein
MDDIMSAVAESAATTEAAVKPSKLVPLGHLLAETVSQQAADLQASKTTTPSNDTDE